MSFSSSRGGLVWVRASIARAQTAAASSTFASSGVTPTHLLFETAFDGAHEEWRTATDRVERSLNVSQQSRIVIENRYQA